jgi:CheY-like chemotaxis protein/anti-sigma regulatory factor (Ser/Thr protein kinase)
MLNSIITNLLDNAVKYTTNGGVTVDVDIETENERDWSVIRIKDTGIGIPAESLDVIFDEFRQVSEGFNRSFEGSGLGLTITKRFVEVMHGRISIESKEGIGTMFILRFPTESAEIMIKESAEKKDDERRIRILHVEDDPTARKLVKYMLQKKYAVDFAENGKKAIAMAKMKQYDIILMDINLGKAMSGVEVTKELKKLPSYEHVPIIAVTAYAMKGDDKMFLAAGCTHYVSKPFQKQMFLELISELTQQQENEDNQENQYNQDN